MTKTFRNNCNINIVQQTSCELLFPCSNAVKNVLFHSLCTSMNASQSWCDFRKAYYQRLCVAYNFGCKAPYNLLWRESVSSHQVQCNISTFDALLRKCTCFLNDAKSLKAYGCVLWCSQIDSIHPYSWNTTTTFYLWLECLDITMFVCGHVQATTPLYFTWPWLGLDSIFLTMQFS